MELATRARAPAELPIDLLMVDLMFTILRFKGGRNRRSATCDIYRRLGRLPDSINNKRIWSKILEARGRFPTWRTDPQYWNLINFVILDELHREVDSSGNLLRDCATYGRSIHDEILSNVDLYEYQPSMIHMLKWLRRHGVRVVIVSNQKTRYAYGHIKHHGIEAAFDHVYTSEELEARKPNHEIWERVLQREREHLPDLTIARAVHMGNSPNSDIGFAQMGGRTVLYDRSRELEELARGDLSKVEIPEQNPEELHEMVIGGVIRIYHEVRTARSWFKDCLAAKEAA